jgi:hypothetical protein
VFTGRHHRRRHRRRLARQPDLHRGPPRSGRSAGRRIWKNLTGPSRNGRGPQGPSMVAGEARPTARGRRGKRCHDRPPNDAQHLPQGRCRGLGPLRQQVRRSGCRRGMQRDRRRRHRTRPQRQRHAATRTRDCGARGRQSRRPGQARSRPAAPDAGTVIHRRWRDRRRTRGSEPNECATRCCLPGPATRRIVTQPSK